MPAPTPKSDHLAPRGFIVTREEYEGPEFLSVHGTVEDARKALPDRIIGTASRTGDANYWYSIVDVSTLKTVASFHWEHDCSGSPEVWQLVENFCGFSNTKE